PDRTLWSPHAGGCDRHSLRPHGGLLRRFRSGLRRTPRDLCGPPNSLNSKMKNPNNLFLIGPMGAGKSAVGRQLSRMLHLDSVDSDDEIETRTGVDIPFIFEKEGEEGFRAREARVIDDLSQL